MSFWNRTREFFWNHRGKVVITSAIAITSIAYYFLVPPPPSQRLTEEDPGEMYFEFDREETGDRDRASQKIALKKGVRSRLLLRVRRHFDFAGKHFFPTLRVKIIEVVDISNAIQQIKQIRGGGRADMTSKSTEANLWEQIKISSFIMLFASAYSVSIVAIILRVQLHILARNATFYNEDEGNTSPSEQELKFLIDSTFKYVFGEGLKNLTDTLRTKISSALVDWTVREKISVKFVEFVDIVSYIRKSIEKDMRSFVDMSVKGIHRKFCHCFAFLFLFYFFSFRSCSNCKRSPWECDRRPIFSGNVCPIYIFVLYQCF